MRQKRKKITPEDVALFKELKKEGPVFNEIAKITGFSRASVQNHLSRRGKVKCKSCSSVRRKALFAHCKNGENICKTCLNKKVDNVKKRLVNVKISEPHFLCFMGLHHG